MASEHRATVAVVVEFPVADLPSGVARRHAHLVDALSAAGAAVCTVVLNPAARRAETGVLARLRAAMTAGLRLEDVRHDLPCVVVGLGTPTMLVAARRLAADGRRVVFDECDSAVQQLGQRLRTLDPRLIAIALWQLALRLTTSAGLPVTYISRRDERADAIIRRGRRTFVVPPSAPAPLGRLAPVAFPLDRIVVPVELASHHTALGFRTLLEAVRLRTPRVPIEVYGPTAPAEPLPAGVTYHGYAPRLEDVYTGSTAVLIANIGGSGVPNKLIEADVAGRPVIVHRSLLRRRGVRVPVWSFDDAAGLAEALDRAVTGRSPSSAPAEVDDAGHDVDALVDHIGAAQGVRRAAA